MKSVTFIEIDINYCSLEYAVPPCMASGGPKCFNTKATCQALPSYTNEVVTLRFAEGSADLVEAG